MIKERHYETENGADTVGNVWQAPVEYFKQDPWRELKGGMCWVISKDGTRFNMSYPLVLTCRGIPVASIVEVVYENAVPRELLCRVEPSIASIHLPQPILNRIPDWVSRPPENKQDLCKEIREFCEGCGFNGEITGAVGLLVYLVKNGWKRIK